MYLHQSNKIQSSNHMLILLPLLYVYVYGSCDLKLTIQSLDVVPCPLNSTVPPPPPPPPTHTQSPPHTTSFPNSTVSSGLSMSSPAFLLGVIFVPSHHLSPYHRYSGWLPTHYSLPPSSTHRSPRRVNY